MTTEVTIEGDKLLRRSAKTDDFHPALVLVNVDGTIPALYLTANVASVGTPTGVNMAVLEQPIRVLDNARYSASFQSIGLLFRKIADGNHGLGAIEIRPFDDLSPERLYVQSGAVLASLAFTKHQRDALRAVYWPDLDV